jgi:hypothetical protein
MWSTIIYLDKGRVWLWQCQIFRIFAKSANKRQTTVTINRILTQKWFLFQNIEDSSLNLTFVTVLSITKVFFWREFESRISGAFLPWREFVCRIKGQCRSPGIKYCADGNSCAPSRSSYLDQLSMSVNWIHGLL